MNLVKVRTHDLFLTIGSNAYYPRYRLSALITVPRIARSKRKLLLGCFTQNTHAYKGTHYQSPATHIHGAPVHLMSWWPITHTCILCRAYSVVTLVRFCWVKNCHFYVYLPSTKSCVSSNRRRDTLRISLLVWIISLLKSNKAFSKDWMIKLAKLTRHFRNGVI